MRCRAYLLALLLVSASVHALDRDRTIGQFHHTAWTARDGAPLDVWAIAQSEDGWMWFGGPEGLHRFDGVKFEPVDLQLNEPGRRRTISTLLALESGELWIGYASGGISRLRDNRFTHFGEKDGLSGSTLFTIERDSTGVMWSVAPGAVRRFDGTYWQTIAEEWGLGEAPTPNNIKLDGHGTLWIATRSGLMRLKRGSTKFERAGPPAVGSSDFQFSPDGRLWYTDSQGTRVLPDQAGAQPQTHRANARTSYVSLFDRDGAFWSVVGSSGVNRQNEPEKQPGPLHGKHAEDVFTEAHGLSGLHSKTIMEDREGNIWVGTSDGIDRFRHTNVVQLPLADRHRGGRGFVPMSDGSLIVAARSGSFGTREKPLWRYDGRMREIETPLDVVTVLHRDRGGTIWAGGNNGIWRFEGERLVKVMDMPGPTDGGVLDALSFDARGRLWVSMVRFKLFRFDNGAWNVNGGLESLPTDRVYAQTSGPDGKVWFGYRDKVANVDGQVVEVFTADDGLQVGQVLEVSAGEHVFVGGEYGLQVLLGGRFRTLTTGNMSDTERVSAILQSRTGDLWWIGARGAAYVSAKDLQDVIRTRSSKVPARVFDVHDGFPGTSRLIRPTPMIAETSDGRVWVEGTGGMAWIDINRVQRNEIAPTAVLRSIEEDGHVHAAAGSHTLAKHARNIVVDYTALSFRQPEQVAFRYRLDGFDEDWQEAGTRRRAFYTNLPVGQYTFRVMARNEDGVWSPEAVLSVELPPAFYQTRWFQALCVMLFALAIWQVQRLRLRRQALRLRVEHDTRMQERERIARDLHDTLLQGMQALILRFDALTKQLPAAEPTRASMSAAIDRAETLLAEGRDQVHGLRRSSGASPLESVLQAAADRLSADSPTQSEIEIFGRPRALHLEVREEVERIAVEALTNAFRHASASHIRARVCYEASGLVVDIVDDGCGIDAHHMANGRSAHFGLVGMRERAERINARLLIEKGSPGTRVSLSVPAHIAYAAG